MTNFISNNTGHVEAYVSARGQASAADIDIRASETTGMYIGTGSDIPSRAVGMREIPLTVEDVRELEARIANPTAGPTRPPRDLPTADSSILYQPSR